MRWIAILALLWSSPVAALEAAGAAAEAEELTLAKQHTQQAFKLYQAGNYGAARVEFQAAYDLTREPEILHNLSMTAERQGQLADAIGFEERYLAAADAAKATLRDRDEARGRILRLREKLAQSPEVEPAKPSPTSRERSVPPAAIGLMAGGGILLAVGIGLGGAALRDRGQLYEGVYAEEVDALYDRNRALNAAAISLSVLGGAALAGGASWAIVHRRRATRPALAETPRAPSLAW